MSEISFNADISWNNNISRYNREWENIVINPKNQYHYYMYIKERVEIFEDIVHYIVPGFGRYRITGIEETEGKVLIKTVIAGIEAPDIVLMGELNT